MDDILSKFKIEKKHLKSPSRKNRVVEHKKQGLMQEGEGIPTKLEGSDGDVSIRNVLGKGLFKYTKYKGGWYSQKLEGSNSQNTIINSNTTDDEILVYDDNIKGFRNRKIKGDLSFKDGVLSLKNNVIDNNNLSENCVDTLQIKSGSVSRTQILDSTLEVSKFRDVTTVLEKNTFAMSSGSSLNVAGAVNAEGIVTFTALPSTGTQASGTINVTATKTIVSGSTLTIYDGNDNHTFCFRNSGESVPSNYHPVSFGITNEGTITLLRAAILNASDLLNVTIYNGGLGLQIQNKAYTASGNKTITQSSDIFTLTGMTSGADGGSFTIPKSDIVEDKKFIFEPEITGSTKRSGNVLISNTTNPKIDYVTAKTDVTTTATSLKDYINNYGGTNEKKLGLSASSSSGAVTITQEQLIGTDGNCTIASNDANITVTQSMQGGVDRDAKYIIISRPLNGLTYTKEDGTIYYDYVNTVVWFNVDGKLKLGAGLSSLRADTEVEVSILSTDANTAVATKTKAALDSFYCTDYKGDEYLPFTSSVVSNNIHIECSKPGKSSGFSAGTSGITMSNVATGDINLNFAANSLGDLSDVTYSSGDLTISSLDKFIFTGAVDYDLSGDITFTENGASFSFLKFDYDQEIIHMKGNGGNTYLQAQIFGTQATISSDDVLQLTTSHIDLSNSSLQMASGAGTFGWGIVSGSYTESVYWNTTTNIYKFMNANDKDDYYQMTVGTHGATTLATVCDSSDNAANLILDIDGDIELNADGGNITFKDAGTDLAEISGNGILSKTVIYFDAETANTIGNGATGVIDWTVNQKQKVTITGTSITCNFTNPPGPCNLMLKVIQGDGSDVIGTWDSDIKWPSNTPPTLSTANGAVDIISFYFDGTNYYGVGSLNFS